MQCGAVSIIIPALKLMSVSAAPAPAPPPPLLPPLPPPPLLPRGWLQRLNRNAAGHSGLLPLLAHLPLRARRSSDNAGAAAAGSGAPG